VLKLTTSLTEPANNVQEIQLITLILFHADVLKDIDCRKDSVWLDVESIQSSLTDNAAVSQDFILSTVSVGSVHGMKFMIKHLAFAEFHVILSTFTAFKLNLVSVCHNTIN
jgi:hypothetical protein